MGCCDRRLLVEIVAIFHGPACHSWKPQALRAVLLQESLHRKATSPQCTNAHICIHWHAREWVTTLEEKQDVDEGRQEAEMEMEWEGGEGGGERESENMREDLGVQLLQGLILIQRFLLTNTLYVLRWSAAFTSNITFTFTALLQTWIEQSGHFNRRSKRVVDVALNCQQTEI